MEAHDDVLVKDKDIYLERGVISCIHSFVQRMMHARVVRHVPCIAMQALEETM